MELRVTRERYGGKFNRKEGERERERENNKVYRWTGGLPSSLLSLPLCLSKSSKMQTKSEERRE